MIFINEIFTVTIPYLIHYTHSPRILIYLCFLQLIFHLITYRDFHYSEMNNMAVVQETDDNISSWHSGGTKDRALTEKDLNDFFLFFFLIENCDFFNPG